MATAKARGLRAGGRTVVFALLLLRSGVAGAGEDAAAGHSDADSCVPCDLRSTTLPTPFPWLAGSTRCVCRPGYTSLGVMGGAVVVGFLEPGAEQCPRRDKGDDAAPSAPSAPSTTPRRRHECQPCDAGKFKEASGNGGCRDCPPGTVYAPAACFDASCSDADVIAEVASLHVLSEHDMQSAGPSAGGWCSLLTSLVSLGNAQDGGPPHGVRACRRAIDAYEDHTVFELALSSPLVMQTLLQSCCICGGGVTDSPSLTHPEACVPFVRGEQSCVDDAQDAVRWGCCACGFGRQVSRAHTQTL